MRCPVPLRGDSRGAALIIVLLAIAAIGLVLEGAALLAAAAVDTDATRETTERLDAAARGAVAVLSQRLAAVAAERLGNLAQADVDELNAGVSSLPAMGTGLRILPGAAATGVALAEVRDLDPLPYDELPLELWTDQLRRSYRSIPPVGGRIATRTLVFVVYATAAGPDGERRSARRTLAVSRVPPHQDAVYAAGGGELCADAGTIGRVAGTVHVDGFLQLDDCGGGIDYKGNIEAAMGIGVSGTPGLHQVHTNGGRVPLTTVFAVSAEMDPDGTTAAWGGRVRIPAAIGARVPATRFATAALAGSGECLDFSDAAACGGATAYHPSLMVHGTPSGPVVTCGAGFAGRPCTGAASALSWTPWPFPGNVDLTSAAADPAVPGRLWHGLYPDPRTLRRCQAAVAGVRWRTFRCPAGTWGWTLDAAALGSLPGGVLAVARSSGFPPAANPDGTREVLLVRNARRLAGALTIHSQLPVVIVGSFNVEGPQPALIIAPRIAVLPNEAEDQLRTSAVWDSVAPTGSAVARALPLTAESNVTIYAVLRSGMCGQTGGRDFGGVWRGAPAVIGDWSRAGLRVVGAVEVTDETGLGAEHCGRWGATLNQAPPSGTPTLQPRSREVLYDPRLLYPEFQPPGSWTAANVPSPSAAGAPSRTPARQAHATGGSTALRLIAPTRGGPFEVPAAVPFPGGRTLPSPPPPLP